MAERYNPSTDNLETEPKLNPSTGISTAGGELQRNKQKKLSIARSLGFIRAKTISRTPNLRILRLQNQLQTQRLQNQINQLKIQRKVSLISTQNQLNKVIATPIRPKILYYPAYSTPEMRNDIDSAFNADINHGDKSLFGTEKYFDETFYDEDFYGTEFDNDPFFHLQIKPNRNLSPLLW